MDNDAFEFDDRRVLAEGSVRLHAALSALGTASVPAAAALCNSLSEWYEPQDLQLARALTAPTASINWHLVRIGPAGEPLSTGMDALSIAPSLARAFAGLQIEMDRERVFPDEFRWTEQGIAFLTRGDGLIASIEPVPVEAPDLQKRERVNDLMKGCGSTATKSASPSASRVSRGSKHCRMTPRDGTIESPPAPLPWPP